MKAIFDLLKKFGKPVLNVLWLFLSPLLEKWFKKLVNRKPAPVKIPDPVPVKIPNPAPVKINPKDINVDCVRKLVKIPTSNRNFVHNYNRLNRKWNA